MLMFGSSKHNKENYPRKYFWTQEKETRIKFNPGLSANRPSNNWALEVRIADSCGHPQLNNYFFMHVYVYVPSVQCFGLQSCQSWVQIPQKIINSKTKAAFILEDILNIWTIIKHFTALGYFQHSRTPVTPTLKGNKKTVRVIRG